MEEDASPDGLLGVEEGVVPSSAPHPGTVAPGALAPIVVEAEAVAEADADVVVAVDREAGAPEELDLVARLRDDVDDASEDMPPIVDVDPAADGGPAAPIAGPQHGSVTGRSRPLRGRAPLDHANDHQEDRLR